MSTEEQLAWERRRRTIAGISAILAGLLPFASYVAAGALLTEFPHGSMLEAIGRLAGDGNLDLRVRQVLYFDEHAFDLVLVAALTALGAFAAAVALHYLATATKARQPEGAPGQGFFRVGRYFAIIAPVIAGVGTLMAAVGRATSASSFASSGEQTLERARDDVINNAFALAGDYISQLATLLLAVALVVVSLSALRVGLLTRFMGVLGILCGVLLGFTLGQVPPVVQYFWFIALGVLFLGLIRRAVPPAWESGRAEPWPSGAAVREERLRARVDAQDARERGDEPDGGGESSSGAPGSSGASRKKRKRRG